MKLLTVTVPCYNSQDYMEKCIQSLLPGGNRVEIIIIDDGSKDNTGKIADEYARKFPDIVRVIHQENGGHGEGINQGLKHATGTYFKVVDSDDTLSPDFPKFLDALEECERQGGVDMVVTNYYYVHSDGDGDRSINYSAVLPENRIFTWEDTKPFRVYQMLTIHSSTFRTEIMRKWEQPLPKHVFYEDNLMIYQTIPYVRKMYYLNADLYRYWIGRPDQSVQSARSGQAPRRSDPCDGTVLHHLSLGRHHRTPAETIHEARPVHDVRHLHSHDPAEQVRRDGCRAEKDVGDLHGL